MSRFASAVHIVTTDGSAGRRGVTATAVVAVSDTPATLLVCLNASSPSNDRFDLNGNFAINTLAAGGEPIANAFAGQAGLAEAERFSAGEWSTLVTGAPVLADALVSFDCRIVDSRVVATHRVLIGEVVAIGHEDDAPPLLYHARGYRLL